MYSARIFGRFALVAAMLLLAACSTTPAEPEATLAPQQSQEQAQAGPTSSPEASAAPEESADPTAPAEPEEGMPPTALEAAATVMKALKNSDMESLAAWVHPDKGVRFSPYAYVDPKKDLVFTRDKLEGVMKDNTKYEWREFAGSGELIELTFAEYFKQFVYDADFAGDAEIALNKGLGQGTTVNNINEVYPKETHDFVEYHIDGIDPSVEGMDWRSLRLVFEKMGEDRALVGIVHDQWTP
ncbi:hypothetical protein H70357_06410 [Paenibacillus sp. FSL H7-0357]|uniref:hypothetical protein n=1 Tax=Paenibacillus sp. FSL H7-0357 TaxID=1536774 RepID=UPI0004F5CF54|nr:hypothetical protein [Paenibacillus sp. FSL H7-0357]AIQ16355.1 hypothetical protein H70357_06410 [Paenibacillus sp. FSL H7-0357]